jgi:hypothetical protein
MGPVTQKLLLEPRALLNAQLARVGRVRTLGGGAPANLPFIPSLLPLVVIKARTWGAVYCGRTLEPTAWFAPLCVLVLRRLLAVF